MRRPGLALASLTVAVAACATPGPDVPVLVEIETLAPPSGAFTLFASISSRWRRTVGSSAHRIIGGTSGPSAAIRRRSRPSSCARSAISSATPVIFGQTSVPLDASQFHITAHGSPEWSLDCYQTEVHRCPVVFLKLWQSLDEIIGDLPER